MATKTPRAAKPSSQTIGTEPVSVDDVIAVLPHLKALAFAALLEQHGSANSKLGKAVREEQERRLTANARPGRRRLDHAAILHDLTAEGPDGRVMSRRAVARKHDCSLGTVQGIAKANNIDTMRGQAKATERLAAQMEKDVAKLEARYGRSIGGIATVVRRRRQRATV